MAEKKSNGELQFKSLPMAAKGDLTGHLLGDHAGGKTLAWQEAGLLRLPGADELSPKG